MRLTIFGATSGSGQQLVERALAAGHDVVALVRDPSRLTQGHERQADVPGDLSDQTAVERAIEGTNAVISVLGPRAGAEGNPIARGTQNILAAMHKLEVRRLLLGKPTTPAQERA